MEIHRLRVTILSYRVILLSAQWTGSDTSFAGSRESAATRRSNERSAQRRYILHASRELFGCCGRQIRVKVVALQNAPGAGVIYGRPTSSPFRSRHRLRLSRSLKSKPHRSLSPRDVFWDSERGNRLNLLSGSPWTGPWRGQKETSATAGSRTNNNEHNRMTANLSQEIALSCSHKSYR